jgi:hypothetical protein
MEGEQPGSRSSQTNGKGNQGAARNRGRGRGAGSRSARGKFSGSLSNLPKAPGGHEATEVKANKSRESHTNQIEAALQPEAVATSITGSAQSDAADAAEAELCFICAEPVQLYSVPPCNHRTCHVCAIRLRALYKKKECTFCKVSY